MKDNLLKFSIIVPIYNVEKYLCICVDSILMQTYTNFELILVDDGSPDNCGLICDEYVQKDSRVKVIHKSNGGLVSARKAGAKIATGDYVVCVDSDDWISKDHLLKISEVIHKENPEIVCFSYYETDAQSETRKKIPYREGMYTKNQIEQDIFPTLVHDSKGNSFPPAIWAKAYSMELYKKEQLAVDDKIKIGEDIACTLPCISKARSIYILNEPLYYYRKNNLSMTKNRKAFPWNGPELVYIHHMNRLDCSKYNFQEQINNRTVHALLNVIKTQFYRKEKYLTIRREIKDNIARPIYSSAIKNSKFAVSTPIFLFRLCMLYGFFFPIYLLSKFR